MISTGDLGNGVTLEIDNAARRIIELRHIKPGRGAAFVHIKIKNVMIGTMTGRTFRPAEKFPTARIDRVEMQYLYADDDMCNLMNIETYSQISLSKDPIGGALKFVKKNEMVKTASYNDNVLSVEPPLFVELEIMGTEPGFAGNTTTDIRKPATAKTDAQISVPLFVGTSDRVKIDTRMDEYFGRAQN